jgi:addiction module HigA family antidote
MLMHDPPHPGELIREICLEPLGLSVTEAAEGLGVTRKTLSSLLNGHSNVSPVMAIRLSKAFGGSPESWLTHQLYFDLWQAQKQSQKLDVKDLRNAA